TDFPTGGGPYAVAVADFNGDGKLDLVTANFSDQTVSILPGTGTGSFGAKTDFGTNGSPRSVAVADFNGDGRLDLAASSSTITSILLGTGTGSFGTKSDFLGGGLVVAGDFNGDGTLDLATIISKGISILPGTGTGSFEAKTDFSIGLGVFSLTVGDFNSDGKLDLAVANANNSAVSILLNTTPINPVQPVSLAAQTDFNTGGSPNSAATGDFNGDG